MPDILGLLYLFINIQQVFIEGLLSAWSCARSYNEGRSGRQEHRLQRAAVLVGEEHTNVGSGLCTLSMPNVKRQELFCL